MAVQREMVESVHLAHGSHRINLPYCLDQIEKDFGESPEEETVCSGDNHKTPCAHVDAGPQPEDPYCCGKLIQPANQGHRGCCSSKACGKSVRKPQKSA